MSLTRIQRDAMTRAQNGDWELADAIEVIARAQSPAHGRLIGGIRQGGRLQMLAYAARGSFECCDCNDENCECCAGTCDCVPDDVTDVITDLDGKVLFDAGSKGPEGTPPDWYRGVHLTVARAHEVLGAYQTAIAKPTQQTLIQEPA